MGEQALQPVIVVPEVAGFVQALSPNTDAEELVWSFRVPAEEPAEQTVTRSRVLLRQAFRRGLVRSRKPEILAGGHLSHFWRFRAAPQVVVACSYKTEWWWAPPFASYDETRHAPRFETEPEALGGLLAWLELPQERRERDDWLVPRPHYIRRSPWTPW